VPDLSIVLEWERPRLLKPARNQWPFVAVRMPRSQQDQQRRSQVVQATGAVHAQLKGGGKVDPPWPYWRYVTPPSDALGLDLSAFADDLIVNFRQLWEVAAPVLDAVHA
jgi:hypothetical protein